MKKKNKTAKILCHPNRGFNFEHDGWDVSYELPGSAVEYGNLAFCFQFEKDGGTTLTVYNIAEAKDLKKLPKYTHIGDYYGSPIFEQKFKKGK